MYYIKSAIILIFTTLFVQNILCETDTNIVSARIESCPGCSLNRLPEVKQFIYEDVPLYDNVEFKKIHGAIPELLFLNSADEEIERVQLSSLSRKECNDLLINKGFQKKGSEKHEF